MGQSQEIFTPEQAAEYLQVDRETIYRYIRQGKLIASKLGRKYRIQKGSIDLLLYATRIREDTPLRDYTSSEIAEFLEADQLDQDIQNYDQIKAAVERGEEEVIPAAVAYALAEGESPLKVWREFRQLTQARLAELVGMSVPFLSQVESGKRNASTKKMAAMAEALGVTVDDLIANDRARI